MCNLFTFQRIIIIYWMDKKVNKHNEKQKPNWDWMHIECYLKTVEANRKSIIWNLTPSIILTNPSSQSAGPNVRLYIDTEKSLQYSNDLGWNWHKSWNIPNISLRLEIKDESTGDFLLSPRNLYAQIFAVKKNTQNEKADRMTLIDVGIRGQSKMQMIDGQVYFSAIKFSSTTYNNEGINFNLLIVLYINEGEFQKPKVLTAVLSPPIFVDSRRSARDYQQKKFSSFVEPFGYDNIEKEFIKRENKSKSQSQIIIKNDPQGFYNYITAPNIRHKVKHPVFLAIKFSNCVKICYNSKLVENIGINELLENLQTKLLKENKGKQKNDLQINANLQEKYFLFVVTNLTDSLKRKKVIESIQTMQNQFIGITCGQEELGDYFISIDNIDLLKKGYKDSYQSLVNICQNYEPQYQEESQDEYYSDQYQQSEKSSKKFKKQPSEPQRQPVRTSQRNKTSIISNNKSSEKPQKVQSKTEKKIDGEALLKKEELFQSQFEAPVFFNQTNQGIPKKIASSAFSKAVGFKNVTENNPIFDTSQLNKAFSNNMANLEYNDLNQNNSANFLSDTNQKSSLFKAPQKLNQNLLINQPINQINTLNQPLSNPLSNSGIHSNNNLGLNSALSQNTQNPQSLNNNFNLNTLSNMPNINNMGNSYNNSIYDNLIYSNLVLSNWLGSVKGNNNALYDNMMNHTISDQIMHKNNLQRYLQAEQQQKMLEINRMPLQNEEQQSILCLIQQIGLYKQLLSQVTYQNQLLSRDITFKQQNAAMNSMNSMNQMKYSQNDMSQYGNILGMNFMGGMNQMNNMNNMSNLSGMSNMSNMNGLGNSNLLGSSLYINQDNMLGNQMGMGNMMISQNRPAENNKEKEPQNNIQNPMANSAIKDINMSMMGGINSIGNMNPMGGGLGGMTGLGGSIGSMTNNLGGGMNNSLGGLSGSLGSNYDIIKSMVLQEMKKQAELKERQKQEKAQ